MIHSVMSNKETVYTYTLLEDFNKMLLVRLSLSKSVLKSQIFENYSYGGLG